MTGDWITIAVASVALLASLASWWMSKGTWLLLAQAADQQAQTWRMLDRYDLAQQSADDAAKYERWAWPRRQKAGAS